MEFKEKNKIIRSIASPEFIQKDRELLETHFPGHELLSRSGNSRKETLDAEILFVLLDKLSPEQIKTHRSGRQEAAAATIPEVHPTAELPAEPVKKNSRKKRSIPGLTGRTSKTKTSKKPS